MCSVDFERQHELGSAVPAVVSSRREPGRESRLHLREQHQPEIDLSPAVYVAASLIAGRVRTKHAREKREPCPVAVKRRGPEIAEMQRCQIPFSQGFCEAVCADLVDLGARKAIVFAIAAEVALVDPVDSVGAKLECRERVAGLAERPSRGRANP